MRIALVLPGFHAYAAEPFVPYWAERVAQLAARHDVTVYALRHPATGTPYDLFGAHVVPGGVGARGLPLRRSPRLWLRVQRLMVEEHARRPFDLVHAWHANEAGFVAAGSALRLRLPLVVHVGGGELTRLPDIGYGSGLVPTERGQVSFALRRARALTVGSVAMSAAITTTGVRRRIFVAPYSVDRAVFAPGPPVAAPVLAHVADMNPVKDQGTLLRALALARARVPDIRLHWVGDGPLCGALRRLAVTLGVDDAVVWWGRVPHQVVPECLRRARAYVHASRHEAQGVALCEAAACGLPIVSTRVGVAAEMPEGAGRTVTPGDAAGMAEGIVAVLADTERAGQAARAWSARYAPEATLKQLEDAYAWVLGRSA